MYHKVPETPSRSRHRIFVTKENFKKHCAFFKAMGFTTLFFSDLVKFWDGEKSWKEFPKKPLILTFDDGYTDTLSNALPILEGHQLKACVYLLANHQVLRNDWDEVDNKADGDGGSALLDLEGKKKLANSPCIEIGSHGYDHVHLPQLSPSQITDQLRRSKQSLSADLKTNVLSFAYPFGSTSPILPRLTRRAGYRFAVNTDQGGMHLADNPHSIFRVNIFPEDSFWSLWKKTSPWYRRYFKFKRHR